MLLNIFYKKVLTHVDIYVYIYNEKPLLYIDILTLILQILLHGEQEQYKHKNVIFLFPVLSYGKFCKVRIENIPRINGLFTWIRK